MKTLFIGSNNVLASALMQAGDKAVAHDAIALIDFNGFERVFISAFNPAYKTHIETAFAFEKQIASKLPDGALIQYVSTARIDYFEAIGDTKYAAYATNKKAIEELFMAARPDAQLLRISNVIPDAAFATKGFFGAYLNNLRAGRIVFDQPPSSTRDFMTLPWLCEGVADCARQGGAGVHHLCAGVQFPISEFIDLPSQCGLSPTQITAEGHGEQFEYPPARSLRGMSDIQKRNIIAEAIKSLIVSSIPNEKG